jgi:hypothetical protein
MSGMWFESILLAATLAAAALFFWPRSAVSRDRTLQRWASENLVPVTPEIASALETAITRRNRFVGGAIIIATITAAPFLFVAGAGERPEIGPWLMAISLGIWVTLALGAQLRWAWFPVGSTRAARLRAVTLADFVPRPLRWSAWLSGAICLLTVVLVALTAHSIAQAAARAAAAIGVLVALVVAEWNGRRAAARPQPARDATELYAQDAWRTSAARYGFIGVTQWGGIATTFQAWNYDAMPVAEGLLRLAGWGLIVLSVVVLLFPQRPMDWTRQRLWPTLRPGEYVGVEVVAL